MASGCNETHEDARRGAASAPGLAPAQLAAITLLLAGKSYADVAAAVSVDPSTLYRWRHDPAFASELSTQVEAVRETTRVRLLALATSAIDALGAVLNGSSDAARVAAARTVLDRVGLGSDGLDSAGSAPAEAVDELADPVLHARVRRVIFGEFAGCSDNEVLSTVRGVLTEHGS